MTLPVILPDRPFPRSTRRPLPLIVLPEWLYDEAKAQGLDLSGYCRRQKLPVYESTIIERR